MLARDLLPVLMLVVARAELSVSNAPEGGTDLVTLHLSATSQWVVQRQTYTLAGLEVDLSRTVMLARWSSVCCVVPEAETRGRMRDNKFARTGVTYNLTHDGGFVE